ncbi:Uncharacterised protein g5313 [Pycnogonum litorale]
MKSVVVLSVITSCLVHRVCNENADDQSHPETLSDAELQKLFNDTSLDDADFTLDCTSPPEVGPCKALMQNFYFDTETNECKTFTYGGCYGNDNRYETAEGYCSSLPEAGRCMAYMPMFNFDCQTNTCKGFIYGGCGGNNNR